MYHQHSKTSRRKEKKCRNYDFAELTLPYHLSSNSCYIVFSGILSWRVHLTECLCQTRCMLQAVRLWHAVPAACDPVHEWKFSITSVKTLTRCRRSARSMFLYVHENSDDFHVVFPTSEHREHCYQIVVDMMICCSPLASVESLYEGNLIDITPNVPHVCETCTLSCQRYLIFDLLMSSASSWHQHYEV